MAVGGKVILPAADPVLSAAGFLSVGATLQVNLTGTSTPANLFTTSALTVPASNPQTSNAAGFFYGQSTSLWADSSVAYDFYLTLPTGESYTYQNQYLLAPQATATGFAPINSPTFTGNPQAPTPAANNSSGSIATTQFVNTLLSSYALTASPIFTGTPLAPTPTAGDNSQKIATTAFVAAAVAAGTTAALSLQAAANVQISGSVLSIKRNVGFSSIVRSGAGAINYTFTTPQPDAFYELATNVENTTQLAAVAPPSSKTATGFALSVLTYNNISNDPSGLSVIVTR